MNATLHTAPAERALQQRIQTASGFDQLIQDRFEGQSGWFCLGTIDGDPGLEKMKQEWYLLPRQRAELAERCAELAARSFNLYWAACLFGQRKRSYAAALASPWLWQDDSPADMACSELIQSSAQKYQALVKLDRPITARERQRLQVAWRDATPGADSCSGNAVQLGRMPGGYNCKRHGRFLVNVAHRSGTFWSADRLLAKAPALVDKVCGVITDLDWPAVAPHLTNIAALLASGRASCIKPETQTGRILAGERVAIASAKLGRMDDSSSTQVAILAEGFFRRGFLDEEIAAVGMHFYREWGVEARKGTLWCKADVARCIALAHAHTPGVVQSPTRYRQQVAGRTIVGCPAASRARADRPRKLDPAMLFARYQAQPELCAERRKARATALCISTATLDRLEDGLEAIGLIEIRAQPGMPGRVLLLGGVINIAQPEVLSGQIAPPPLEVAPEHAQSGETIDRSPQCKGETQPSPEAPCLRPGRAALVAEAFDALDGCTRLTDQRIRQYIEMNYPEMSISPVTLHQLATNERTKRRFAKQNARELQKARALFGTALRTKSRAIAGAAAQMHRTGDKRAPIWDRRAGIYAQVEAERQQAEQERIECVGYALTEQAEMLDLVDQARPERQRIGRATTTTRGGVCSPQPSAPAGAPAGLIARLHALKAQRQQAQL